MKKIIRINKIIKELEKEHNERIANDKLQKTKYDKYCQFVQKLNESFAKFDVIDNRRDIDSDVSEFIDIDQTKDDLELLKYASKYKLKRIAQII